MSDIPSTIQIGAVTYTVTSDPDAWVRYEHANNHSGFAGHTDHATATIYINPDLAPEVARLTLWHEVMHALCYTVMGDPDWHHLGKEKSDREEAVVAAFESPIVCVLRDNPALVAYLTAARKDET
jgi:hypothetical protein